MRESGTGRPLGVLPLVRPEAEAWRAVPVRPSSRRQMLVAWLTGVATTAAAFVADRGWTTLDEDPWEGRFRLTDMLGLSGLFLSAAFVFGGWTLGRRVVLAAPLVLAYAAVPHSMDGYASAPVWWLGALIAGLWALAQVGPSIRQLRAVRALAHRSDTGQSAALGASSLAAVRAAARRGLPWAAGLTAAAAAGWTTALIVLDGELGLTYEEAGDSFSDVLATAAAALSILSLAQWLRCAWQAAARASVGNLVWQVPAGYGPVRALPSTLSGGTGILSLEQARATPGCNCVEEFLRADPDEDEELLEHFGMPAAAYCPAHGIDQVNSLSAEQFLALATDPWLWDENSPEPMPARPDADRSLLVGFAGHAFPGVPARMRDGQVENDPRADGLAEERQEREDGEDEPDWDEPKRPLGGVLDRIDLRPAGLAGHAIRYRHGRVWLEKLTPPQGPCRPWPPQAGHAGATDPPPAASVPALRGGRRLGS